MALQPRTKKLVGVITTLAWLVVYIILAWGIGIRLLPHAGGFVKFAYYAVAGMAWIVPVGLMLPWMSRVPEQKPGRHGRP
ncbi:MAG: DUF2842 domain-containing protein [Alphaproteobacteria bacterium]|nr:DUF2842 domain-containing protein [Alphaproteobacteria bacterium]MBV9062780.1 DUF2842 domain-containing protein [Alphaproteobacteria bacterium]